MVFGSALHDICKISFEFQAKNTLDCGVLGYPTCPDTTLDDLENVEERCHHSHAAIAPWRYAIQQILQDKGILIEVHNGTSIDFFAAFASHHGAPLSSDYGQIFHDRFQKSSQGKKDLEAIEALVHGLCDLMGPPPLDLSKANREAIRKASWLINGIVNVSDWLGSDMACFQYVEKPMDLGVYWEDYATKQAHRRYQESGLKSIERHHSGFEGLFPTYTPLPLQAWANEVPLLCDDSSLFIIEAVTGSGKTEGGLTLESRLSDLLGKKGLYVALPTQGSAEKMFNRVLDDFCGRAFVEAPTVALAHSSAGSNSRYKAIKQGNTHQDGLPTVGTTTDFLSFSRKAALLAQVGVGTIDQLILSALPRHQQSLRLAGLLNKVVIIDEIHSYAEYQQVILERFLEMAGTLGIPVILLSATLSTHRKQRLIRAFRGTSETEELRKEYPLYTAVGRERGVYAQNCPEDEGDTLALTPELQWKMGKEIRVRNIGMNEDACIDELIRRANAGECVCWIRNSVNNAKDTYDRIKERFPNADVSLAHAKYMVKHRMENDEYAENTFGWDPDAPESRRSGKIVIATQVYEQSLDLDFDFMVSDLAPIEVLIQRLGRLCRHFRIRGGDHDTRIPEAWIYGPYFQEVPDKGWLDCVRRVSFVYGNVMDLWKTQREIAHTESWTFPKDSRVLIENVHEPFPVFSALEEAMLTYEEQLYSDGCEGSRVRLDFDKGWYAAGSEKWEDNEVYTRLMEPTSTFYLCEDIEGRLIPFGDADNWNDCKITVRKKDAYLPLEHVDLKERAQGQGLGWLLRRGHVLPVKDGVVSVMNIRGTAKTMAYTRETGFVKL